MAKPDLPPMNGSDSNSFPLEARKNEGAILENITPSFSEPEVRASREKITSNMTAFIGGKSGFNEKRGEDHPLVILGIDPGTRITGYGIIKSKGSLYQALDYGCIRPPANRKLTDRYLVIFQGICTLIDTHKPDILVVETQYVHKNVQSAIKLGMARGIAIIAAKKAGLTVVEYSPTKSKLAVVGNGRASKQQVQGMIKTILNLKNIPPEDAADALSLAICHAHAASTKRNLGMEI